VPRQGKCCCTCIPACNICIDRRYDLSLLNLQAVVSGATGSFVGCASCAAIDGTYPLQFGSGDLCSGCSEFSNIWTSSWDAAEVAAESVTGYSLVRVCVTNIKRWLRRCAASRGGTRPCCWQGVAEASGCFGWRIMVTPVVVNGTQLGLWVWLQDLGGCGLGLGDAHGVAIINPSGLQFDCSQTWNFSVTMYPYLTPCGCTPPTTVVIQSI
jgi:hypothetical protein